MDPTNSFIFVRFAMTTLLGLGGISCIIYGYRLFRDGTGLAKAVDKFDLKTEQTRVSAAGMSVGSVLMLTSVGWGYFCSSSIPRLELEPGITKIGSIPDFREKYNWASAIGEPVVTTDKQQVGTITGVITGQDDGQSRFVLTKKGDSPVTVDAKKFKFSPSGSVSLGMSKKDFDTLYDARVDPESYKKFNPEFKG